MITKRLASINWYEAVTVLLFAVLSFFASKNCIGHYSETAAGNLWLVIPGMLVAYPVLVTVFAITVSLVTMATLFILTTLWGAHAVNVMLEVLFPSYAREMRFKSAIKRLEKGPF